MSQDIFGGRYDETKVLKENVETLRKKLSIAYKYIYIQCHKKNDRAFCEDCPLHSTFEMCETKFKNGKL